MSSANRTSAFAKLSDQAKTASKIDGTGFDRKVIWEINDHVFYETKTGICGVCCWHMSVAAVAQNGNAPKPARANVQRHRIRRQRIEGNF
jgi:hypothetical protein